MRKIEIYDYPREQIKKWRRIDNLVRSHNDVTELETALLAGDEQEIKRIVKGSRITREALLEAAREAGIKNYGLLRKEELLHALKGNKRTR